MDTMVEELRKEDAKLLELWKEAHDRYGWRLGNPVPYHPVGTSSTTNSHPMFFVHTVRPPTDADERNTWAAIWKKVLVTDPVSGRKLYYISFPHWFEQEIAKDRSAHDHASQSQDEAWVDKGIDVFIDSVTSAANWMWDLAWSQYAEGKNDAFLNAATEPHLY